MNAASPLSVLERIRSRTPEAMLGIARINHSGLTGALRHKMSASSGEDGWPVLPPPLIEAAHPYLPADKTMGDLAGNLVTQQLVDALAGEDDPREDRYRLERSLRTYLHQLKSWQALIGPKPASVLVASGTGSGKTECFLIPLLDSLARQAASGKRLDGVQAIVLYPLNALIESQRERLSDWCRPFEGRIRYALYNGDLAQSVPKSEQNLAVEQVPDRDSLRASPPPILVTNLTMLEYMLVRAADAPIIEASKGKLRWIILDEAHTHIGSAAAELALLLRRVMLAFDVEPKDVRVVATSATIGSGPEVKEQLGRFLADVSGVDPSQIIVIEGTTAALDLPAPRDDVMLDSNALAQLTAMASQDESCRAKLFEILAPVPAIQAFMSDLDETRTVPWDKLEKLADNLAVDASLLVEAMARANAGMTDKGARTLGPFRIQAFHRAAPGVWSCIDPCCSGKPFDDWAYGALYPSARDACRHCGSPVLTVAACSDCGEPYLLAKETVGQLTHIDTPPANEFVDDLDNGAVDPDADVDDAEPGVVPPRIALNHAFSVRSLAGGSALKVSLPDGKIGSGDKTVDLVSHDDSSCAACHAISFEGASPLRPLRFGAPLLLRNAMPLLLEASDPAKISPDAVRPPSEGRRLLSFTDSRQGTARLAAYFETDSERAFVRSLVYHLVQASSNSQDPKVLKAKSELEKLTAAPNPMFADMIKERQAIVSGAKSGLPFNDLIDQLASRPELATWIAKVWDGRGEGLFEKPSDLAKFMLLREFARRPRNANSAESMGLAALRFESLTQQAAPRALSERGLVAADWHDFLHIAATWFLRANFVLNIDPALARWIVPKNGLKRLIGGDNQKPAKGEIRPPSARPLTGRGKLAALIYQGLGLSSASQVDQDCVADLLDQAFHSLSGIMATNGSGRALDFKTATVEPVAQAFLCPRTRRVLDRTFARLTPWGSSNIDAVGEIAKPIVMPRHPGPLDPNFKVADWLAIDPSVGELRHSGIWTDLHDRAADLPSYSRAVEHSAQQPRWLLRQYEDGFKRGEVNILNCSTTMEMGVDIGSVSTVLMSNVPPSVASYRQRIGRAGRRGQPMSLSFTFCKDRPLDREVFVDPTKFLKRSIAAPSVSLESRPIVQRHVNALLLADFMREIGAETLKSTMGAFLETPKVEGGMSWAKTFASRTRSRDIATRLGAAVHRLTVGTCLDGHPDLFEETAAAMDAIKRRFDEELHALDTLTPDSSAARKGIELQRKRLTDEYLLAGLADRAFLPGHGFPTDVVAFIPVRGSGRKNSDEQERDRKFTSRDAPQRSLDLAIRDYAPGSEIVLDGIVHRSAGVTLNWKRPADENGLKEVQALRWFKTCRACGEVADTAVRGMSNVCHACGSENTEWAHYLKPAGFTSDPRDEVHAEIESTAFVPPEPVRVSASGQPWRSLAEPSSGRFRATPEGTVFHHNLGEHRHGFAICLQCGRAEPEVSNEQGKLNRLVNHKPLRTRSELRGGVCQSIEKPFSIVNNLALGTVWNTDVFELELPDLETSSAAWALASALRDALCRHLGVESSELGIAASSRSDALGRRGHAILLFDRASGGAGFATQAPNFLETLLTRARQILDCRVPGCTNGCSSCVVNGDTSDIATQPDRLAALRFLDMLLVKNQTPGGDDARLPGARLVREPLIDLFELAKSRPGPLNVTAFANGLSADGTGTAAHVAKALRRLSDLGAACTIAVDKTALSAMGAAERLALRDLAIEATANVTATTLTGRDAANPRLLASLVDGSGRSWVWTSREVEACQLGASWGLSSQFPIIRLDAPSPPLGDATDLASLLPVGGTHTFIEVTTETNRGLVEQTARAIASLIGKAAKEMGLSQSSAIINATYTDRYLRSPVTLLILLQTVKALRLQPLLTGRTSSPGHLPLLVRTAFLDRHDNLRRGGFQTDWADEKDREDVSMALGHALGMTINWQTVNDAPHARSLILDYEGGRGLEIILDQGFGAWIGPRLPNGFFAREPSAQANILLGLNGRCLIRPGTRTHLVIGPPGR
jgi:DEAD/DEAH box helicase domain-containing protein